MTDKSTFDKGARHHMLECACQDGKLRDPVIIKDRPLPSHMTRVHRTTSSGYVYDDIEYDDALEGKLEEHREEDRSHRRELREKKDKESEV